MKNKILVVITAFTLVLAIPVVVLATTSVSATVKITVKKTTGEPMANHKISCVISAVDDGGTGIPPAPQFTYLETNSSGIAVWNPSVDDTHTYKCYSRVALSEPDFCYSMSEASPSGELTLNDGDIKEVTITGTYSPTTCKTASSSSSQSSITSSSSSSSEPTADISLPGEFTKDGSQTTDLSILTETELEEVKNFTIENKGVGMIEFLESLDLSSEDAKERLEKLNSYIKMSAGSIEVDTQTFPLLNVKAEVTMYGLDLVENKIKLLRNGNDASNFVSNVRYDKDEKSLSFEVSSFSKYEIAPNLSIDQSLEDLDEVSDSNLKLSGFVGDKDSQVTIYLNEKVVKDNIKVENDGSFEYELELKSGDNKIKIAATSSSDIIEDNTLNIKFTGANTEEKDNTSKNLWILVYILISLVIILGIVGFVGYKKGWFDKWLKKKPADKSNFNTSVNQTPEINSTESKLEDTITPSQSVNENGPSNSASASSI